MAIIATALTIAGAVESSGILDRSPNVEVQPGTPYTPCPGQPTQEAQALLDRMTASDRQVLIDAANDASTRDAIVRRDASRLAWHVMGGDDCRQASKAGRAFAQTFWELTAKYSQGSAPVPLANNPGQGGGSTGVLDTINTQILQPLLDTARNVAAGAVSGGAAAAQGAQAGSGAAVQVTQSFPTVIVLGLAALLLIPVLRK